MPPAGGVFVGKGRAFLFVLEFPIMQTSAYFQYCGYWPFLVILLHISAVTRKMTAPRKQGIMTYP